MPTTPKRSRTPRAGGADIHENRDPDALRELGDFPERLLGEAWQPAVDVFETTSALVVRLEMAGVLAEDVKVNVDGEVVKIRGVRKAPIVEGIRRQHQMEIAFGPFETAVRIGIPFERDRVSAHLENGLLEVRLPKRGPVTVEVKTDG